jgi:SAM-dependent methyltransferase
VQISTKCAICDTLGNSQVVFPSTVDSNSFTAEVFSARRLPDRRHYQWVSCKKCGLYRSDPVADVDLSELYKLSSFDYSGELHGLKNSYRRIVEKTCPSPQGKHLVEVGGGNGFFLEEALAMGFEKVTEIEPSHDARDHAPEKIRQFFVTDILRDGVIPSKTADVVVIFHVLDHLSDPKNSLVLMRELLKHGGSICIAVHNVRSISARILKSRSPIFDVEHTYLYSKSTLRELLRSSGFEDIEIHHYKNSYSLAYILHLLPIKRIWKVKILDSKLGEVLRKFRVTVPLGNMWASAKRP